MSLTISIVKKIIDIDIESKVVIYVGEVDEARWDFRTAENARHDNRLCIDDQEDDDV